MIVRIFWIVVFHKEEEEASSSESIRSSPGLSSYVLLVIPGRRQKWRKEKDVVPEEGMKSVVRETGAQSDDEQRCEDRPSEGEEEAHGVSSLNVCVCVSLSVRK